MDKLELIRGLSKPTSSKILLLVMDGLGGLPCRELAGKTELEAAKTPNLDKMARNGALGEHYPMAPGITPGSGPAHFGLFGYDPVKWNMGRGVLETLGIGFDLKEGDVAVRTNFCTLDKDGKITDRRAGRIPTSESARLSKILEKNVKIAGAKVFFEAVRDYRGAIVLRGKGLGDKVADTDPQVVGKKPLPARGGDTAGKKTAKLLNEVAKQGVQALKGEKKANGILMRGISSHRSYPSFNDIYGLKAACVASYPMYRGVAKLIGMDLIGDPQSLEEEVELLEKVWGDYEFFFLHFKYTDSKGEDGNVKGKMEQIEKMDKMLPRILKLKPDVTIVTGDHSTPTCLKSHSWHPVPFVISAPALRAESGKKFGETECRRGAMGTLKSTDLMPIAMAQAGKLLKFGA